MLSKYKFFIALALLAGMVAAGISSSVLAENRWIKYNSPTGLFEVRIPNEYETSYESFNVNDKGVVQSGEMIATIDQRPYKNAVKNYIVKFDQTFGSSLNAKEIRGIIDAEFNNYVESYRPLEGLLKNKESFSSSHANGEEIYLSYEDPDMGLQGMKVRIMFTGMTVYQQIVVGPDHIMESLETRNFLNSFKPMNGIAKSNTRLQDEWTKYTSPFELFSILLPPESKVYVPASPKIQSTDNAEVISFAFTDPVRHQSMFYKVYGHRFSKNLTYSDAKNVMLQRHVAKHLGKSGGATFQRSLTEDKTPVLEAEYAIAGPKGYPYMNTVKLRGMFTGNYLMVQEVMGSHELTRSPFVDDLLTLVEFTPKHAHEVYTQKLGGQKSSAPAKATAP